MNVLETPDSRQCLVSELMKNSICASIHEAERMADGILNTEKKTNDDRTEVLEEIKKTSRVFVTKQDFDSLIKINNKIIEANFVKLKNYTDQLFNDYVEKQKKLMAKSESSPVQQTLRAPPSQHTSKGTDINPDDVSIEKMFYYGQK